MNIKKITTSKERETAYEVRKIVFVDEQHVPIEEEIDEYEETATHFICQSDGKTVGTSRLRFADDYGKLERIAVLKAYRGQSIGSKLIREMETEISSHQLKRARLNAQTHAITFYESLGYHVISTEEFMDAGIPHVTMEKKL